VRWRVGSTEPCRLGVKLTEVELQYRHAFQNCRRSEVGVADGDSEADTGKSTERVFGAVSTNDGTPSCRPRVAISPATPRRVRTKQPGESALLLLDAVAVLSAEGIEYAVVGAMAGSVHGVVRASLDADAIMSLATQKLRDLQKRFIAAGFETELRYGDADDPIAAMLVLTDRHENRVDLLVGLRGLEFAAFARAVDVPFQGETLRVIGREDFIAMKVFAGGPQDLSDARHVIHAARNQLDLGLLRRLAEKYGGQTALSLQVLLSDS
jgi:hypothetical protein